jgi:hypothetical protein
VGARRPLELVGSDHAKAHAGSLVTDELVPQESFARSETPAAKPKKFTDVKLRLPGRPRADRAHVGSGREAACRD